MKTTTILILILSGLIYFTSCKKIVEVGRPESQLTTATVFADTTTALSALSNIYALFNTTIDVSQNPNLGLYSDELAFGSTTTTPLEFFQSSVSPTNQTNLAIWKNYYSIIYACNSLINQLYVSPHIPSGIVKQFSSEAKFIRGYSYFYLVNAYNKIPLLLTTNVDDNSKAFQVDTATVYKQIIQDLTDAQNGLSASYVTSGKVRVNSLAATGMLARVYLYLQQWINAENAANKVINSGLYTPLVSVNNVFQAGSRESILQFWTQNGFIASGSTLIPSSGKPNYTIATNLLNAFEAGDLRKSAWLKSTIVSNVTYYYPYKYHNRTTNTTSPEYLTALRIGEQYLIRAEARINQAGKIADGLADLNILRARARDAATAAVPNPVPALNLNLSKNDALIAIQHERQVELFTEWGHRFFDLKRTGQANLVLGNLKTTWKSNTSLSLPIPQNELTYDPNLKPNPGY